MYNKGLYPNLADTNNTTLTSEGEAEITTCLARGWSRC